jgi:4-hydroxy-tetrahydrodipicolinate reductase
MGRALTAVVEKDPAFEIVARFDRPDAVGEGLVDADTALSRADMVIDFTLPAASAALAPRIAAAKVRWIVGATGFTPEHIAPIAEAAKSVAVVRAGNFSLGLNVVMGFVAQAARVLPPEDWDIEIFEAHHKHKVDAPSGAALMLGAAAAAGRGVDLAKVAKRGRDGITGERTPGDIGFSVLRGGGIIGDHSVTFAGEEETLTLSHSAKDRGLFARGAIAAAKWAADRPPGEYDMQDVLGFRS